MYLTTNPAPLFGAGFVQYLNKKSAFHLNKMIFLKLLIKCKPNIVHTTHFRISIRGYIVSIKKI